jgi:hypothetical protein
MKYLIAPLWAKFFENDEERDELRSKGPWESLRFGPATYGDPFTDGHFRSVDELPHCDLKRSFIERSTVATQQTSANILTTKIIVIDRNGTAICGA